MKKSKTLFSPRKLIYLILIVILVITIPDLNTPSMGDTNAIVTLLSVDKSGDGLVASANVIKPSGASGMCCETYSATNSTLGEAIEDISYMIGKELAFSQCEVMAFGDELSNEGIMSALDYMTRVKKVSRNTLLINVGGDIKDFNKAIVDLSSKQQLKIENILGYDNKFTIHKENSIEEFYQRYYSPLGVCLLPRLEIGDTRLEEAIEVAAMEQSQSGVDETNKNKPKFLTNNGEMTVYDKGEKIEIVDKEMTYNLSLLSPSGYKGTIKVDNVNDELYDNATILFYVTNSKTKMSAKYDGDIPKVDVKISLSAYIEEIEEDKPSKKFLIRNEQFMSDKARERLKEEVIKRAQDAVEFCKENELDILNVYSKFDKYQHKKTNEQTKELDIVEFLKNVEYNFTVVVKSTY